MKHPMDDRFTFVRSDTFINLLKYLLSHYAELYPVLAPEGFEQSPYASIFITTIEERYQKYRLRRATKYKFNRSIKGDYELEPLLNREEFASAFPLNNPEPRLAGFGVYLLCIGKILDSRMLIYDAKNRCYSARKGSYSSCIHSAVVQTMPDFLGVFDVEEFSLSRYDYNTDLSAICGYLLKLLKAKGLDCTFTLLNKDYFRAFMNNLETMVAETEIQRIAATSNEEIIPNLHMLEKRKLRAEKQKEAGKILLRDPVADAYIDVYGRPLDKFHYRALEVQ